MRIAVTIISLALMLVVFLQSCAASVGGSLGEDESLSGAGALGFLVGLLYLLGGAFALGLPRVSIIVFAIAALIGVLTGATTDFRDLIIWGVVAAILALMSLRAYRTKLRDDEAGAPLAHSAPVAKEPGEPLKTCPECAERVQAAAKVCRFCGFRFPQPVA
jgi:hypothetical protein